MILIYLNVKCWQSKVTIIQWHFQKKKIESKTWMEIEWIAWFMYYFHGFQIVDKRNELWHRSNHLTRFHMESLNGRCRQNRKMVSHFSVINIFIFASLLNAIAPPAFFHLTLFHFPFKEPLEKWWQPFSPQTWIGIV